MSRASIKTTLIILTILAISAISMRSVPSKPVEPLGITHPRELSIEGLRLGDSIDFAMERFGQLPIGSPNGYAWNIHDERGSRELIVWVNGNSEIVAISGERLEHQGRVVLKGQERDYKWLQLLGEVKAETKSRNYCGFSPPRWGHFYRYPEMNLTVWATSEGMVFKSPIRSENFFLSTEAIYLLGESPYPFPSETLTN